MRRFKLETIQRMVILVAVALPVFLLGCTASAGEADIVAEDGVFNRSTIRVRAGTEVSITFENRDSIAHNLSIYRTAESTQLIFGGEALSGPGIVTYTFTAPEEPGTYYFQCDFHPSTMNGRFVVTGTVS